jgi:predicted outer membrane repeat protein
MALVLSTTSSAHAKPNATITVQSLNDGAADSNFCPGIKCRLRDAIAKANPGDEIQFGVTGTITLDAAASSLIVNKNLTITGPTGSAGITISGANTVQVFIIDNSATVTLNYLTISNGLYAGMGGGIVVQTGATLNLNNATVSDNQAGQWGGGIYADTGTTLNLTNVTVANNQASGGGGIYAPGNTVLNNVTVHSNRAIGNVSGGGGIKITAGTATLTNVTVRDNECTGTPCSGGGISNSGQLTMRDSAVTGNSAKSNGGISNGGSGANATLTNVTISGNTCSDGISGPGCGFASHNHATAAMLTNVTIAYNTSPVHAGIATWNNGSATLRNTIVANNTTGNCYKSGGPTTTLASSGYNLSSDTTCTTYFNQASDLNNTDPLLAALALNSPGTTKTHALLAGSPALDKIPSLSGCLFHVTTDQRGVTRPQNSRCDIGAYELVPTLFLPLILR